jgi:hypothetical protein
VALKQFFESFDGQTSVLDDSTHRKRVDRIVSRDRNEMATIAHYDVFALPQDLEPCSLENSHRPEMIYAGKLRHR